MYGRSPHLTESAARPPRWLPRSLGHVGNSPATSKAPRARPPRALAAEGSGTPLPPSREAVAQTPGEAAGSLLRVGSENGHLVRRTRAARREVVAHGRADVHFLERAAASPRRLCATASRGRSSGRQTSSLE